MIIIKHNEISQLDQKLLGGKAYNLALLGENQFDVPEWFCVTTELFEQIKHKSGITNKAISLNTDSGYDNIEKASKIIRNSLLEIPIPKNSINYIIDVFDSMFPLKETRVSVRSSVVGEDSGIHSFAGQMDSFLNISAEDLIKHIKLCWASAFTSRAILYRIRKNIPITATSAAVIVQKMVRSESAGVIFTCNPKNRNKSEYVISAAFGLGEGVVADKAESDTYYYSLDSGSIKKEITNKLTQIISDSGSGVKQESVDKEYQNSPVLSDKKILELVKISQKIENFYKSQQDIEWAFDENGNLNILQSRPVTNSPSVRLSLWDNSNIVESYPGILTPLTFSFVRYVYECVFKETLKGFGANPKFLSDNYSALTNMVGYINGRIYYNLLNWYSLGSVLQGGSSNLEQIEMMIGVKKGIHSDEELKTSVKLFESDWFASTRLLFSTTKTFMLLNRQIEKYLNDVSDFLMMIKSFDYSNKNTHELMELYYMFENRFLARSAITNYNDFFTMKFYAKLKEYVEKWGPRNNPNLHNDLLCGETGVESVEPVKSMLKLASIINKSSIYLSLFKNNEDPLFIWNEICFNNKYEKLNLKIEEHLNKYGDRSLQELKLETPHLRDNPSFFISLLRDQVKTKHSIEAMEANEVRIRSKAEKILWESVRTNPVKKAILSILLKRTRLHVKQRENLRLARTRLFGVTKRIFRSIGENLFRENVIKDPEDIFYLECNEIFNFIRGTSTLSDISTIAQIRKKEYEGFKNIEPFQRLVTRNLVYTDLNRAISDELNNETDNNVNKEGSIIKGVGCSQGKVRAKARIVHDPYSERNINGEILVTKSTDPGWVFLILSSSGIVVEKGSLLSHTAIIGRELGIPTIVGATSATNLISQNSEIEIDGQKGTVKIL